MFTYHYSPLKKMPYAQAKIRRGDNNITLISYTTRVAVINEDGWVCVFGLYSRTTIRHIGAFAAECCNTNYHTLKKCYTHHLAYNIHTGEYMSLETGEVFEG